jgi:hypothetical protein
MSEKIKALHDDIASTDAMIDQAQACLDENRKHLTDDEILNTQANIDIKRLQLELARLQLKMLEEIEEL